jgi:hypothetical protein
LSRLNTPVASRGRIRCDEESVELTRIAGLIVALAAKRWAI